MASRPAPVGICSECSKEAKLTTKGTCQRCYKRLWDRERNGVISRQEYVEKMAQQRKQNSFGVCKSCGKAKRLPTVGMCSSCYKKVNFKIVKCVRCGNERPHMARGLCNSCFNTVCNKNPKLIICSICGEERPFKAKGLCTKCYCKQHKKTWTEKVIICSDCGQERAHMAKGLCVACYWQSVGGVKYYHQRQAKKSGLAATLTGREWVSILEKYNYSCAYCGKNNCNLNQEHWIPLSKGGGYTADNIVPACRVCNSRKHTMTGDEFLEMLKREKLWIETSRY